MRLIKFVAFLFYRYYSEGSWGDRGTALFRTKVSMSMLVFLHLMQIATLIGRLGLIFPDLENRMYKNLYGLGLFAVLYGILSFLIKEKDVLEIRKAYEYNWDKVFDANARLIAYIILSIGLTVLVLVLRPVLTRI